MIRLIVYSSFFRCKIRIQFSEEAFYESEKIYGAYDWSDPYVDDQAYYGGWSREEVKNELADAYE